ncbi:MAG: hypothetical protein ABI685_13400 [Ferruginibacter sp.]
MASNSEKGHAKNVAGFKDLITYSTGFGSQYNPSRKELGLPALNSIHTDAEAILSTLNDALPAYNTAVAVKDEAFKPFNKLITRVFKSFSSCGALKGEVDNAFTLAKKLKGQATKTDKAKEAEASGKDPISQAQLSMDMRMENFDKFIKILASNAKYKPNETELQVTSLQALHAQLKAQSEAIVAASGPVLAARSSRNTLLYAEGTGLVDIGNDAKKYLRSVFPGNSIEYKKIAAIKFSKPKKK